MIRPGASTFAGEQSLRFTHILVRDAAYEQMLKETRAELHERFASWVQRTGRRARRRVRGDPRLSPGAGTPQPPRPRTAGRARRRTRGPAATRLSNAGRRALARGDMSAAVNLLERAVALVPKSHPERSDLLLKLGIALAETGEVGRADALLSERISEARRGLPYLSYRDGTAGSRCSTSTAVARAHRPQPGQRCGSRMGPRGVALARKHDRPRGQLGLARRWPLAQRLLRQRPACRRPPPSARTGTSCASARR